MKTSGMRIVCGTDFSVHSAEAATVAAELARRLNEPLELIHVFENAGLGAVSPKVLDELLSTLQKLLLEEAERLRKLGATVEEKVLTGQPYAALVEAGGRADTRFLVVSSLGRIAPSRFLVGSVAERTAEKSPVPTLVVRSAEPFQSWARGERPLKIFVGYDFSATSDAALRWVKGLKEIGPCDITVGYVSWPPQERTRLGIGEQVQLVGMSPEIQQLLERDLKQRVRDVLGEKDVKTRVGLSWGRADPQLIEAAGSAEADLMVVGTHQRQGMGRFWLGSVSRGILHHAPMSVAIVPMPKAGEQVPTNIPEFRRVLVTTDFSELGNRAIPFAYSVLRRGGKVCLLHVSDPKAQREPQKQRKESEARLGLLMPAGAEALGIETHLEVVESRNPSQAICQAAERFGADLICMASHGRSGLSKTILGSVAHDVMTCSKRPLLVVRPPEV
jgi:nucleotide-binding universal stress UspA family protein